MQPRNNIQWKYIPSVQPVNFDHTSTSSICRTTDSSLPVMYIILKSIQISTFSHIWIYLKRCLSASTPIHSDKLTCGFPAVGPQLHIAKWPHNHPTSINGRITTSQLSPLAMERNKVCIASSVAPKMNSLKMSGSCCGFFVATGF